MTNLQFYLLLSPAIASLMLVVLAWLHQNQRISDLRADTNRHFDELRADTNRQFVELRADTNRQFVEVKGVLATLAGDYRTFYGMEQKLEGRVDELSKRQ